MNFLKSHNLFHNFDFLTLNYDLANLTLLFCQAEMGLHTFYCTYILYAPYFFRSTHFKADTVVVPPNNHTRSLLYHSTTVERSNIPVHFSFFVSFTIMTQ